MIEAFEALEVLDEIIVINNNAAEGTSEEVAPTSAIEVIEHEQGYGAANLRGIREATGDLIVICEPDATFVEGDIFKLLEYTRNFDVVFGSRTMNDMIWDGANMGWFLRFGNWAVAKMMMVLYNSNPLTDVGCTYRAFNREVASHVLEHCQIKANFFSPEMMINTITGGFKVVQIPVNYKDRVGVSSATGDLWVAFKLGVQMILLILKKRLGLA